jgi:hypothetical protein
VANVAVTADDFLAQHLCAASESVARELEYTEALDAYCAHREQFVPFLEAAAELREASEYRRAVRRQ